MTSMKKHKSCEEKCSLTPPVSTICETAGCQKQQAIDDIFRPSPLMARLIKNRKTA